METSAVKVKHPDLDAHGLTTEMRTATQLARAGAAAARPSPESPNSRSALRKRLSDLVLRPAFEPNEQDRYDVGNFMHLYDIDFVEAVFRAILKRAPDDEGFRFYLRGLRSGTFERVDVIAALLDSDEGKRHNVRVTGLSLPVLLRRLTSVPLIGYPIRVGLDVLRLPLLVRRLHESVAATNQLAHSRTQQVVDRLNATNRQMLDEISGAVDNLHAVDERHAADLALRDERFAAMVNATENRARQIATQVQQLRQVQDDLSQYSRTEIASLLINMQQLRRELAVQRASLVALRESNPQRQESEAFGVTTVEISRDLDALYVELEDRFRGSRDDVKKSQEFYLPLIQSVSNPNLPVFDLGCGRGEWLELLRDAGTKALGVDTNRAMIEICRERGLEAIEGDALAHLRNLPAESLRAVTGFHIIEHLQLETLMRLVDQIMRALQPGGFVAFETPNPDNLFVSGNYFYFDPSHHHPLPGKLVKLFLEASGFQNVEITPLHPCAEGRFTESDEVTRRLNELFYGPMDYAIVGWKLDR